MPRAVQKDIIKKYFVNSLLEDGVSPKTLKSYKSDLSHFSQWMFSLLEKNGSSADEIADFIPFIKEDTAKKYKAHLVSSSKSRKTINRKLSTLRRFSNFLFSQKILSFDFAHDLENLKEKVEGKKKNFLLEGFESHLFSEKVAKNTAKNYLSDVKHFLTWMETKNIN